MSLFRTSTPAYQGQDQQPPERGPDWIDAIRQWFRTGTPQYLTRPATPPQARNDSRDR